MSTEILKRCFPNATHEKIMIYSLPLIATMDMYNIYTPKRQAAFLAQIAHESGSLKYVREIASGEAYEGRLDLGNTEPGDGVRFKGRGLIQITGRANYKALGDELEYDFIAHPDHLERPGAASMSAGWFWHRAKLNELADVEDFRKITKRINGGYNGMEDRLKHWEHIKKVLYT